MKTIQYLLLVTSLLFIFSCSKDKDDAPTDPDVLAAQNGTYVLSNIIQPHPMDADNDQVFTIDEVFKTYTGTSKLILTDGNFTWEKLFLGQSQDANNPPLFWDAMTYSSQTQTGTYTVSGNTITLAYLENGNNLSHALTKNGNDLSFAYSTAVSRFVYEENGDVKSGGTFDLTYEYSK
jgi:hypothetical protein